jgi:Zn finger protein HypA/HybF involved in hydrogenase expression
MKSYRGPPMTLGNAAAAKVTLIVWCKDCRHQVEPDPAEMAARYGAETTVTDWAARLACGKCGSQRVEMVVSGTKRR